MSTSRHPKGLYLIFATSTAERFSYYGMRAIFILFLIPVLLVLLAVYLIYRSHREKNMRIERSAYDPEKRTVDEDRRNQLLKQSAIKNACWGVGLIVIEWIIDFTDLLYVVGVVMLCIAANDWLTTLIKKKKE